MKFGHFIFGLVLSVSSLAYAHDEGHGPKLSDAGKYGGLVSPVIDMKEAAKGAHATVVYKAELVRTADGKVRLYLYDQQMTPIETKSGVTSVKGFLEVKVKGKYKQEPFSLALEGKSFVGLAPKSLSKPFNIDFHIKEAGRELLTAFDNLD
jgi:hypothetical protein